MVAIKNSKGLGLELSASAFTGYAMALILVPSTKSGQNQTVRKLEQLSSL